MSKQMMSFGRNYVKAAGVRPTSYKKRVTDNAYYRQELRETRAHWVSDYQREKAWIAQRHEMALLGVEWDTHEYTRDWNEETQSWGDWYWKEMDEETRIARGIIPAPFEEGLVSITPATFTLNKLRSQKLQFEEDE